LPGGVAVSDCMRHSSIDSITRGGRESNSGARADFEIQKCPVDNTEASAAVAPVPYGNGV
jgi:hypothetical protein